MTFGGAVTEADGHMVICDKCGNDAPENSRFCNSCGSSLDVAPAPPRVELKPGESLCPKCRGVVPPYMSFCPKCGSSLESSPPVRKRPRESGQSPGPGTTMPAELLSTTYSGPEEVTPVTPKQESPRPWIVAVLLIGGFALALMSFIELMIVSEEIGDIYPAVDLSEFLTCCGIIVLVAAVSCLVGAVFSYKRSRHSLVVVAAAVGMLGVGPLYLGSLLSLIAMIIAAVSRSDYRN